MPSQARDSFASSSRLGASGLPEYEQPTFSLNPNAQRALSALSRDHRLNQLDSKLKDAQDAVSEAAAETNDRLRLREDAVEKHKKRKQAENSENVEPDDVENNLVEFRDKVDRMTQRMDDAMKKLIDGQHGVQFTRESMNTTADSARANASTQASTQAQSQRRTRRRVNDEGEEEDDDENDEEYQEFEPTDPAGATQNQPTTIDTFRTKMDNAKIRHQSHSLTARYAGNNDYVNFRRVVHDARHPDDGVPLPPSNEWFQEGDAPAPGVTTRAAANADDDSDDDIAVSRATISTKCPLTLQEFKEPLTSIKCSHSFEGSAIKELINNSEQRINTQPGPRGRQVGGDKALRCPVGGCQAMLARADLHTDPVLVRKIKRLQRAKELEEEDGDDDDGTRGRTQRNAAYIDDDDDEDGADIDALMARQTQPVKPEPRGTQPPARTPARNTAANDAVMEIESDGEDETMED